MRPLGVRYQVSRLCPISRICYKLLGGSTAPKCAPSILSMRRRMWMGTFVHAHKAFDSCKCSQVLVFGATKCRVCHRGATRLYSN